MSLTMHYSATTTLKHDPYIIRQVLLNIDNLAAWNPAFSHVEPAEPDGTHPITIHNLLKGKLTHAQPTPNVVRFQIKIPGLTEESTFTLSPNTHGTKVTHTINQRGFLTTIIGNHEASLVPHKRLTRLTHTLNATHNTFPHE